jgi:hypothetical protein
MRSSPTISYPMTSRNNRSQQSSTKEIPGSFLEIAARLASDANEHLVQVLRARVKMPAMGWTSGPRGQRAMAFGASVAAAAGLAVAVPVVAGLRWDGYRPRSQYISELGARHAPDGALVSLSFGVIGLLLLLATWGAWRERAGMVGLAVGVGLVSGGMGASYAVSAVARCEPGCPDAGGVGAAQQIHNVAGTLGYTLAIVGLVVFGLAARRSPVPRWRARARPTLLLAPVALVVGWLTPVVDDERGLLQRLLEVLLLGWLLAIGALGSQASRVDGDGHAAHAGRGLPGGPLEADRGKAAGDEVEVVEDQRADGGQGLGDAAGPVG